MAHGVQAFRNTTQAIANNSFVALSFSSVNFDTDVFWAVGNPTRLTVPGTLAGQFIIIAEVQWANSATGYRELTIRKNGATILANLQGPAEAGGTCEQILTCLATLVAGDYIELLVNQLSGGSLNTATVASYAPNFSMTFMGS